MMCVSMTCNNIGTTCYIVYIYSDPDEHKEYQRQRYYLEKSVDSLKRKLAKDSQVSYIPMVRSW